MHRFTGTIGDDSLIGSDHGDSFDMSQGGDDTVAGGLGNDEFHFGAAFTGADQVDGGAGGRDALYLQGDYSAGVVFGAQTMTGIEQLILAGGFSYALSGISDANVTSALTVNGLALGAGDALSFDGSGLVHAAVRVLGGAGDDVLTGGGGRDVLSGGLGDDSIRGGKGDDYISGDGGADTLGGGQGADQIRVGAGASQVEGGSGDDIVAAQVYAGDGFYDGGTGFDILELGDDRAGDRERYVLSGAHLTGFEVIRIGGPATVTTDGTLTAPGQALVIAAGLAAGAQSSGLKLDAHLEQGDLDIMGGTRRDVLTGGSGDDHIDGGGNTDIITGGGGQDTLAGGTGASFVYGALSDSTVDRPDLIQALDGRHIDLSAIDADTTTAGDQAFHIVGALDGHAGELALSYDAAAGLTTIAGDVDGDGVADFAIQATGDETGFAGFVL